MLPAPKTVARVNHTEVTAGATVTTVIDRLGYDYAVIDICLSGKENTTPPTVIKLAEDVSTNFSTVADVAGYVGGTSFTLPAAQTTAGAAAGPTIVQMRVDLRNRKRYLRTSVAAATNSQVVVHASLFRAKDLPNTAAKAGVGVLVS